MSRQKNLKRNLLICLLAGSAVMYTLPLHAATSVVANNALPQGGQFFNGNEFVAGSVIDNKQQFTGIDGNVIGSIAKPNDLTMNVHQANQNAVIKWGSFDVGGSATVNFTSNASNFNTLNYVNSGSASQIYGTINGLGGNIYVVNTAGVQIGPSAQINVGSLYVSNKNLDNVNWEAINNVNPDINSIMGQGATGDAALMSLGNINATNVTFEGNGRIVIDSERITNDANNATFRVNTNDAGNVLIGYDAYVETDKDNDGSVDGYKGQDKTFSNNVYVNGKLDNTVKGYMWVEDVEQLQAINTNLGGNYALRNSIDATSTDDGGAGFKPIGLNENGKVKDTGFTGKFDGIDYNIFGLTINNDYTNVGLFGETNGATINNVTLVGGSVTGAAHVGAVVGSALNGTVISNVINSASVNGIDGTNGNNIGGIVGVAYDTTITNAVNTGAVDGKNNNVGGLVGLLENGSTLNGNSYNLGDVSSEGHNVGGLVGHAVNSTIGNPSVVNGKPVENVQVVYNRLDVEGAYNVGGIVGNMVGTIVQNAENSGNVTATGYTTEKYIYHSDYTVNNHNKHNAQGEDDNNGHYAVETVNVANVGGIAGKADNTDIKKSIIKNVTNSGNVSSNKRTANNYYDAGNVGGIVGSAVDTDITNATNKENEVRGAHNVGGVAGYFGGVGTVSGGVNDGGDIMATGARNDSGFVKEIVRKQSINNYASEEFTVGNIGGIVGYMYGDSVKVTGSANRGTVHTDEPVDPANVKEWQKAANVGGVVGKIDRSKTISDLGKNYINAAVSNSYNTGDILGYTGVGGVIGMMYNGEVAGSYNLGYIRTTRQSKTSGDVIDALNMGGIVGDATEDTEAKALIYDVYNKGQIGDEEYKYFGRHVGGIVGRLSGTVEKAYNTGAIYNGYNVVGGIVGWMPEGSVKDVFNTGNITVYNQNKAASQVGGIVGAAYNKVDNITIENAYNLGTIRSFKAQNAGENIVGGILGYILNEGDKSVTISNVYTTGNLYADDGNVGSIFGDFKNTKSYVDSNELLIQHANYIRPDDGLPFEDLEGKEKDNSGNAIEFGEKGSKDKYNFSNGIIKLDGSTGKVDDQNSAWRIYNDMPILNAFLPNAEDYFDQYDTTDKLNSAGIGSIQYGTAYDPLLTIINANKDLEFKWDELGVRNDGGLAVYGAGLKLDNFQANGGSGYFGGILYADDILNLNAVITDENQDKISGDIKIGSGADIYGSAVNINADGKVTIYGDVTATGNGTTSENDPVKDGSGSINITAGDVDVYGTLTSAKEGQAVTVPGISGHTVSGWKPVDGNDQDIIKDKYAGLNTIGERFEYTTGSSQVNGNITINAGTKVVTDSNGNIVYDDDNNPKTVEIGNGNVNLYFGNQEEGLITSGGDLNVTGTGNVFVNSDLDIAGNMTLTSTGKDGEVLLTLTNIGKVQADRFMDIVEGVLNGKDIDYITNNAVNLAEELKAAVQDKYSGLEFGEVQALEVVSALVKSITNGKTKVEAIGELNNAVAVEYMHDFMDSFNNTDNYIALNANSGDAKLTVDMWDGNKFNFKKYDSTIMGQYTFVEELNNLEFYINNQVIDASKTVYVEVSTGEQLKGIQDAVKANNTVLGYNYALMGDINASDVTDYEAIGTSANGFTGTFDGRGNRIIGLTVDKVNGQSTTNAGIFSTIGEGGTVKNVNIYSGNFEGTNTAGSVAGVNNGRIENVTGFGNTVTSNGNAGGIVGENNSGEFSKVDQTTGNTNGGVLEGGIYDVESTGSVIAGSASAIAGGLVATNDGGLANSFSDSAVTVKVDDTNPITTTGGLGGVIGVNTEKGNVQLVDSLGVTNGGTTGSSNVGGVIGINNGNMYSGYNESIVSGNDYVGGIIGQNTGKYENDKWNGGTVENVVNATGVTGSSNYVGGLVGTNTGSVTNGRNNGTITGTNYVGGLVGDNADEHSILTNLVNDSSAEILGVEYVGGIAGKNSGTITADRENNNLINRGSITGHKYVGGVAGLNVGTITNTNIDVELKVNNAVSGDHQYFGGIVGQNGDDKNEGTIENATNSNKIVASNASYVGGIVGWNTEKGKLIGMGNSNEGEVIGGSYVGGVIGKNDAAIGSKNAAQVGITNEGIVIATQGGAGGLIGENNNAAITNTIMTNKGEVHGNNSNDGSGTGGLIGTNSGAISYSSMTNEVTGTVTGVYNVGGLIGVNKADITGGRENTDGTDAGMYINKIYNNGVIKVGSYTDANDDGKYEFTASNGQNIGGLFGANSGKVEAAYNTGAINASGSTNVGGIAGANSGTLDQVFNTVYNTDGTKGAITGGTNVGGLVGTNSGTLINAYNTTEVKSTNNGVVGNAVGLNDGTDAEVNFVYDVTNTDNKLIGDNNGNVTGSYSGNEADGNVKGITYVAEGDRLKENTYQASLNDANTWKFYDGYSNPLLKVFLTMLTVDSNKVDLVYNAGEQDLNIGQLVQDGIISAPVVKDDKDNIIYDGMDAYHNTVIKDETNKLGNSELLQNTTGQKDAGTYDNWLYSGQIASGSKDGSGFNPNNLGYDIVYTKNDSGETGVEIGKATINIDLGKVEHTYGNADVINGTGYFKNEAGYGFNITNSNLTQEMKDELNDKGLGFVFEKDNALTGDTSGRVTEDVKDGGYTWSANFELSEELKKNYQFDDNGSATLNKADGQSIVNQAKLEISVDDAETMPGVMPNFTGTNIQQGLVNGDVVGNYDYALDSSVDINVDDVYTDKIGISFGNSETYYDLDNVDWSTIPGWEFLKNYDINFDPGTLTVDSEIMPDLPDNWPNNRWDYLFSDNPFDRNENFRERKAEVNFVDGAMEI